jgi:hypothetical protein
LLTCETVAEESTAAAPAGEPVLEMPTLHSIGVHWIVAGDANQNAEVQMNCRVAGGEWREMLPLVRVERGAHLSEKGESSVEVPAGAWLFAGSALFVQPDTAYELRLVLADPDGGGREALLQARTIAEPTAPTDAKIYHVMPGSAGGDGSALDPFRGFAAAQAHARPGTIFLLRAGSYPPPWLIRKSGEAGRPIIWRAAGDGEVIIDRRDGSADAGGRLISADQTQDVWFEGLTLRHGGKGIRIVVRGCTLTAVEYGIVATVNADDKVRGWFISDTIIEGPSTWPRTKGIEDARGVQLTGEGHVVCYNRIHGFADGIDTFPSRRCAGIDIHHNEISAMTDDGIELDYSERNVRCFSNRLTDVYQGISTQPLYGGPAYIVRNAMYNVVAAPFKLHNSPSGVQIFHNTSVKAGAPLLIHTSAPVRHCRTRNNLFIGTDAGYAFEASPQMIECDFDFDGIGGGPWKMFLKWNDGRYATHKEVLRNAPIWRRSAIVDASGVFASGVQPPVSTDESHAAADLRLQRGSDALDRGEQLPGINDGFTGNAPDLGAYEAGATLPHYGPRSRGAAEKEQREIGAPIN